METNTTIRPCVALRACRRADRVFGGRGSRRGAAGFSILELVIVMAIVVTLAVIAVPRFGTSIGRYKVEMAAKRVATDLALAQTKARATSATRQVQFDAAADKYTLPEEATLTRGTGAYQVNLGASPYGVSLVAANRVGAMTAGSSITTVRFDGYGRPDVNAIVVLTVGAHTRCITIDKPTGCINVVTP